MPVPAWQPFADQVVQDIIRRLRRGPRRVRTTPARHELAPFDSTPFRFGVVTSLPIGLATLTYGMRWDPFEDPSTGQVGNVTLQNATAPEPWPRDEIGVVTHAECWAGLVAQGGVFADPYRQLRWSLLHNGERVPGYSNVPPSSPTFYTYLGSVTYISIGTQVTLPADVHLDYLILRPGDVLSTRFDNLAVGGSAATVATGQAGPGTAFPNLGGGGGGGGGGNPVIVTGQVQNPFPTYLELLDYDDPPDLVWSIVLLVGGWRCRRR